MVGSTEIVANCSCKSQQPTLTIVSMHAEDDFVLLGEFELDLPGDFELDLPGGFEGGLLGGVELELLGGFELGLPASTNLDLIVEVDVPDGCWQSAW